MGRAPLLGGNGAVVGAARRAHHRMRGEQGERIALLVLLGMALYAVKVLYSPRYGQVDSRLVVGPSQVVQLVEAGDRGLVAEGAVGSAMVVGPEPAVKGRGAFCAGGVERAVGPAGEQGADQALGLAVGPGPVGAGARVAQPQGAAGERVDRGAMGGPVVRA
jgi:hypothetical protein